MIKLHTGVAACAFVGMCACGLSGTRVSAQEPAKQATAAKDARSRAAPGYRQDRLGPGIAPEAGRPSEW